MNILFVAFMTGYVPAFISFRMGKCLFLQVFVAYCDTYADFRGLTKTRKIQIRPYIFIVYLFFYKIKF